MTVLLLMMMMMANYIIMYWQGRTASQVADDCSVHRCSWLGVHLPELRPQGGDRGARHVDLFLSSLTASASGAPI